MSEGQPDYSNLPAARPDPSYVAPQEMEPQRKKDEWRLVRRIWAFVGILLIATPLVSWIASEMRG